MTIALIVSFTVDPASHPKTSATQLELTITILEEKIKGLFLTSTKDPTCYP